MLKQLGLLVTAAILGSVLTLGISGGFEKEVVIRHQQSTPAVAARYFPGATDGEGIGSFADVAEGVMDGVVHITSTQNQSTAGSQGQMPYNIPDPFREFFGDDFFNGRGAQPRVGTGSGVIISDDGYIVTNNHVVADADEIEVSLYDNRSYTARVIGTDPSTDLALIKIDETGLKSIPMGNSDEVRVGDWVLAVGNPFNLTSTVTAGIVSAKARNIHILQDQAAIESFIQTDAAVNPGNSGGALVDMNGGLIGINTAIASNTGSFSGYSFAVPVSIVRKIVEDLLKYGSIQRGYLGVMIQNVDGNLAEEKNLNITEGVFIEKLTENSSAKAAGLKPGDVITAVNGIEVKNSSELIALIGTKRPGDKVTLTLVRDQQRIEKDVILRSRSGESTIAKTEKSEILNNLGADFADLGADEMEENGVDGGVKVAKLYPGTLRKATTMREGFIITNVDGKKVRDVKHLADLLENKQGGIMLEGFYPGEKSKHYYAFGL